MSISKNNDYTTGNLLDYEYLTLQTNCNRFKQTS